MIMMNYFAVWWSREGEKGEYSWNRERRAHPGTIYFDKFT